jgi:hypothetical protein
MANVGIEGKQLWPSEASANIIESEILQAGMSKQSGSDSITRLEGLFLTAWTFFLARLF